MRTFVSFLTLALVPVLFAFDSATWLGQREVFAREAERLKKAYATCVKKINEPAENVSIPIETHKDGSVKLIVRAAEAQFFLKEGLVWGKDVQVEQFDEKGKRTLRIDADNCVVDRNSQSGWAEGRAHVQHGQAEFRGRGIYFSSPESYLKVFDGVEIDLRDVKDVEKVKGKGKGEGKSGDDAKGDNSARATSRLGDYDGKAGVAMLEGDSVMRYTSEYTLCADRIFMFFAGTNELNRAVAIGTVSITNGNRVGTCDRVTYRRSKGELEMFGTDAAHPASLVEREGGFRQLEGSRIKFWADTRQVEVEDSRITVENNGKMKLP